MGWDVIDETAWQMNEGVMLTYSWSWMMRLHRKEIKQYHLLSVGHGMGQAMTDETAWQSDKAVSPTYCWLWNETLLMRLPGKEIRQCHVSLTACWSQLMRLQWNTAVPLTYCWSWDGASLMRLPSKEINNCYWLPVGHGMRHHWWDCLSKK